jgi:hypothetical protein
MPIIDYYLTKHPILTKIIKVTNPYITASIDLLNSRLQSEEVQSKGDERRDLVARFLEAKGKGGNITDDVVVCVASRQRLAHLTLTNETIDRVRHDNADGWE